MSEYLPFLILACFAGIFYIGGFVSKRVRDSRSQPTVSSTPRRRSTDRDKGLVSATHGSH